MESVNTNFKSNLHGFSFQNSFDFPDFFQIKLPIIPSNLASLDDLVYGLCGGMCFSALDYYHARISPPHYGNTDVIPWPYFLFFWQRQLDSLRNPVIPKLFQWMLSNDITLAQKSNRWSIPQVKERLNSGEPTVLVLIRVKGISDPTNNHQVLAIGYEFEPANKDLKIQLYDPNFPGEQTELTMNLSNPNQGISLAHSKGGTVRGFFPINYKKQAPPIIK
jgi:hypothetical protein